MKRKVLPMLIAIGLIALILFTYFGVKIIEKYTPTKEVADIYKLLGVSQNQVALILDEEIQEVHGLYVQDQTYVPVTWVNKMLNDRFYWDAVEKLLVYALPQEIVYADDKTVGENAKPLIWITDQEVYLSLGLVMNYTDIRLAVYDQGEHKRVFINTTWEEEQKADVKRVEKVRVAGGIKSPIITEVRPGGETKILEAMEHWSKVVTPDGYIGYVENKALTNLRSEIRQSSFVQPEYKNITMDEKICLVWHQVTSMEANAAMEQMMAETKGVNVISPTWFALSDNEGNYASYASREYVDKAHDMGLQVWALIDNFSDDVSTEALMTPTSNRKRLIEKLMQDVEAYDLDGLNLDFEGIKESAGRSYVQFMRELSIACREKEVVLSIDNYVPAAYNQFYNRKEQGMIADYVIVMGYDEHYASGEMGSVASIEYVKKGIEDTLAVVPKEKVINAVPFYTRVWTEKGDKTTSKALGIAKAEAWVAENQVELEWDDKVGQYYGERVHEEGIDYVWMEEEASLKLKMNLIKENDLAGVACWKLGLEPSKIWDIIQP